MSQVITFENYQPTPRYDGNPWTEVRIQEAATADAANADWTLIETITLDPVDADPENPASRDFTTENASDTDGLWYRLIFVDASGDDLLPTVPVQNVTGGSTPYTTTSELAAILKVNEASNRDALERVLLAAAGEIDAEIGRDTGLAGWQQALAAEVNLERAVEHWQQMKSPFGVLGLGLEGGSTLTARDSWERHAHKLAPLKESWGLA
jgi:hypothetical protein